MYLKIKDIVPEENEVHWSHEAELEMEKERKQDPIYDEILEE